MKMKRLFGKYAFAKRKTLLQGKAEDKDETN